MKSAAPFTLIVMLLGGCAATGPYAPQSEGDRSTIRAQQLTQQAAAIMDDDPIKAEELLREALDADLFHGPAHNNLGVLHLSRGELYEAASEFEWARKLMPGHPDPRMNLALTLERAGRVDEAMLTYETALEVYPNHLPTLQALCRCQLRHGRSDAQMQDRLKEISMRGGDDWRDWARLQLTKIEH